MGMFNSILTDLRCPAKDEVANDSEIQIEWRALESRTLSVYRLGDVLENIEPEYDNTWIRTDYICGVCSTQTTGKNGLTYIKTDDQQRHLVFVRIDRGRIREVLTEEEFDKTGVAVHVRLDNQASNLYSNI